MKIVVRIIQYQDSKIVNYSQDGRLDGWFRMFTTSTVSISVHPKVYTPVYYEVRMELSHRKATTRLLCSMHVIWIKSQQLKYTFSCAFLVIDWWGWNAHSITKTEFIIVFRWSRGKSARFPIQHCSFFWNYEKKLLK
jgi:hypothetical protein